MNKERINKFVGSKEEIDFQPIKKRTNDNKLKKKINDLLKNYKL